MKKTRKILGLCLCFCLLLSACGCGASGGEQAGAQAVGIAVENPYDNSEWTKTVVNPDAIILTLAAWAPSPTEEMLVETFNRTHSDYQIEMKIYYENSGSDESALAAIDSMTRDFLDGNYPDLFSLNSMDIMSMTSGDILMDLYPLMEQDEEFLKSDYLENIWAQFEQDGHLYELVPSFLLSGIAAPASDVGTRAGWTYEEWLEMCDSSGYPINVDQHEMQDYMILYSAGQYIDLPNATCHFDCDSFISWLEVVKSAPTKKGGDYAYDAVTWLSSVMEYATLLTDRGTDIALMGFPSENGQGVAVWAMDSYGICSATQYPEACWEFMKLCLSDDYYSWMMTSGFPAKRSVLENQLAAAQLPKEDEASLLYGWKDLEPISSENVAYLLRIIDTVDHAKLRYDAVQDILEEELSAYLAGDKSAEETAQLIQNRVQIYISEQS